MDDQARCPFEIDRPLMLQRWEQLTFLHWRYDVETVQRLLPPTLRVEVIDGSAWVGLIPFRMTATVPGIPSLPWVSRFLETNVRTYVVDAEGRAGIWFFSLDASRLGVVAAARGTYRLPYIWSAMRLTWHGDVVAYQSRRQWPGCARSRVAVKVGRAFEDDELTELDHRLTARWVLFSPRRQGRSFTRAAHPPWPLHHAAAVTVDDELVAAAGLPRPIEPPIVHYSPGVEVRIAPPGR